MCEIVEQDRGARCARRECTRGDGVQRQPMIARQQPHMRASASASDLSHRTTESFSVRPFRLLSTEVRLP